MTSILQHCAIAGAPRRTLSPGEVILVEGENSGLLFVLIDGTLEVLRGETLVAIVNEPGAFFGEMAELLDRPHTATVRAMSAATVYELHGTADFLRSHPEIAFGVARLLARRLYAATTYLVDLKRQFEGQDNHFGMVDAVLESLLHHQDDFSPGSDRQPDAPR